MKNINKLSTSFTLAYHLDIFRRLPRDLINASDLRRYLSYWFLKNALFLFSCRIAFLNSLVHHFFFPAPLTGHFRPFFSSCFLFSVIIRSISANVFSARLSFGLKAAWMGPSGNSQPHLSFGTRIGSFRTGVFIVGCGLVHGRPIYFVHFPSPMCSSSASIGWVPLQTLSCM